MTTSDNQLPHPPIEGVIWDLDGTKYEFLPGFYDACDQAVVRAAQELWPVYAQPDSPIPDADSLFQMAKQSYAENQLSYAFLVSQHGFPEDVAHHTYHRHAPLHLVGEIPGMRDAFTALSGLQHVIYTHADHQWAKTVLESQKLAEFYPDDRIIAAETVNFARKHRVRDGFDHCARITGLPFNKMAMVDDTAVCLAIPKELGMTTILLTHGRDLPAYDYVDYRVTNGAEAARLIARLSL